jgi:DNA-binding response OmpR family regulator
MNRSGHRGLEVCEADSGAQALERFATAHPDIVVPDVIMPGLDGFATCAKLRESVRGNRVPILIMTGLDDKESIAHAYEQGATDFF